MSGNEFDPFSPSPLPEPNQEPPPLPLLPIAEAASRPKVWPVFLVVFLSLWVQALGLGVIGLLAILEHPEARQSRQGLQHVLLEATETPRSLLLATAITMLGFGLLAVVATRLSRESLQERLRLSAPRTDAGTNVLAILGVMCIQAAFMAAAQLGWLPSSPALQELGRRMAALTGIEQLLAVLIIGMAPGVCEELLFRGYAQSGLSRRWGPWVATLLTALMFGFCHLDVVQGAFAALMGVYLGLLTERAESILPAMLCHATNNTVATVLGFGMGDVEFSRPGLVFCSALIIVLATGWRIALPMVKASPQKA